MRLLQEADLVVSPTQFEANYLADQGIPPDRNLVLPMAIDKKDVTAATVPASASAWAFGLATTWSDS